MCREREEGRLKEVTKVEDKDKDKREGARDGANEIKEREENGAEGCKDEEEKKEREWKKLNEGVRVKESCWVASALCNTAHVTQSALILDEAVLFCSVYF